MAKEPIISINTATIGNVSAQANTLGSQLEETRTTLSKLQTQLNQSQNVLDGYFGTCSSDVVPTKRLNRQKTKMETVVSLLSRAAQLAVDASNNLDTDTAALELAVAAMGAKKYVASVTSIITAEITGESDCGDGWTYVGEWAVSPLKGNPKITSHYGKRNLYGSFHYGVDFGVPVGTQVCAPVSGTILMAYTQTGGGNCIYLLGDDGYVYEFAHLSKFQCAAGDRVEAGSYIADSGKTGQYVTGAHLHLGVYKADSAVKNGKIVWKKTSDGQWYIPGSVDPEVFFSETYGIEL